LEDIFNHKNKYQTTYDVMEEFTGFPLMPISTNLHTESSQRIGEN